MSPQIKKIGWIGCGVMGRWMCQHLVEGGYSTTVYSRTASKCAALTDLGASLAMSPKEVAEESDVIFVMVGLPSDVESVVWGHNGVLSGLREGSIVVDMTTSRPQLAQRLASSASSIGAYGLDAPVSGGDIGARTGTLSIMVGGSEEACERIMPLLKCMGRKVTHMGAPGAGQHTKMANQILIATNMIGVCESLLYAHKTGLNVDSVLTAVEGGAAGSWSLTNLAPRMLTRDFTPGFSIDHFVKDMEIALDVARTFNLALPGLALAHQLYVSLKAHGSGAQGTQALLLALESLNNTTLDR